MPRALIIYCFRLGIFPIPSSLASLFNAFIRLKAIIAMMMENGSAATIIVFCSACNPPEYSSTRDIAASMIPQMNLIRLPGVRDPLVVIMPKTNVPESAEVMKKVPIRIIARIDNNELIG